MILTEVRNDYYLLPLLCHRVVHNRELHELLDEDSEKLTVKEFLLKLLEDELAEFNT